jgi:hypothetical protein
VRRIVLLLTVATVMIALSALYAAAAFAVEPIFLNKPACEHINANRTHAPIVGGGPGSQEGEPCYVVPGN